MNQYLLDTHTLIWFLEGDPQLSSKAKNIILDIDNQLFVSTASLWEMAIKISIKKLKLAQPLAQVIQRLATESIEILPIDTSSILILEELPFHHKDPFDRMLIAQTLSQNLCIISVEDIFDDYGVRRIW